MSIQARARYVMAMLAVQHALVAAFCIEAACSRQATSSWSEDVERLWVPLSGVTLRGPATAKVTLVLFSDYQSRHCARAYELIQEFLQQYSGDIRVQIRQRPLPNHAGSQLASEAALAAAEQGHFWRFHDLLFAHRGPLVRPALERLAQDIGLDMGRFLDALDSERARKGVDADSILAAELGFRGAPVLVINGRPLRGLPETATLKKVIDAELATAGRLLARSVPPRSLYRTLAQPIAEKQGERRTAEPAVSGPSHREPDPRAIYRIAVEGAPARGPSTARVTMILWSDFECAQCSRYEPLLNAVADDYPRDVRIVWKSRPVPDHHQGMLAAEAALAAGQQDKFWQMHDLFFWYPGRERAQLEHHAEQLGLDMKRFREALDDRVYAEQVAADLELADRLNIKDLPMLFINGHPLARESWSREALKARIEEEMRSAARLLAQGVPPEQLYAHLIAGGADAVPGPDPRELPPLPEGRYLVDIGRSPIRGQDTAAVTIVVFSDFQCPYCARFEKTLASLQTRFRDQLRVVWKDSPSPVHAEALLAHEAARAAREQGQFWEMHDKIFARPSVLARARLERYAVELGLDLGRFRDALDRAKFRRDIEEDVEYGASLAGPSGTPAVFVNGRLIPGAYPFETFQRVIEEELKHRRGSGGARSS